MHLDCEACFDTGIVFEHRKDCDPGSTLGDCCLYRERYCNCGRGRDLKRRETGGPV